MSSIAVPAARPFFSVVLLVVHHHHHCLLLPYAPRPVKMNPAVQNMVTSLVLMQGARENALEGTNTPD